VFDRRTAWSTWHALDHARMRSAADALVGTHDFAAFAQVNHGRDRRCGPSPWMLGDLACPGKGGDRGGRQRLPLQHGVRIIAGTLCEAGRGRIGPDDVRRALATGDRAVTGPTLPHGLRLEWVRYGARSA
jgi:tRNA pseudouridine38-40 synthase